MWSYSQENNCPILSIFAKTVLTLLDRATFLTDNKNYPKISIYSRTEASSQI